jgi:hypothetical protein
MTYKLEDFRHFHLGKDPTSDILSKIGSIADSKSIWTLHCYFARITTVQISHALHFSECDKIAIFKAVSRFIEACYQPFLVLCSDSIDRTSQL